ncbi:hypothetical protein BGZ49_003426 [Haplosporangium sp. Z 27]|nr:hypothetical protein BGZ49_003426 [Haplosporangium sp. Z 27]
MRRRYNNILFYLVNYINPDVIEVDILNFDIDIAVMPMSSQWQVNDAYDLLSKTHKLETMAGIKNTESKNNTIAANTRKQYYIALENHKTWCKREYQHELRKKYEAFPDKIVRFFSGVAINQTATVMDLFKNMMGNHVRNVQYRSSGVLSKDSGLGEPISDPYTVYDHLLALKATWIQKKVAYSPYIREHFCLAVRHSMLLTFEDLRRLNLVNMFSCQLSRGLNEIQQAKPIRITAKNMVEQYAILMFADAVLALLDSIFSNDSMGEVIDFDDSMWQSIKLVTSYFASEDSRTTEIQPAATREESRLRMSLIQIDTVARLRHKELGCLRRRSAELVDRFKAQYYLSNLAIPFARGIAGFKEKPFHLRRNEIVPSESLQRKIFPFIETAYSAKPEEERALWLQTCRDEMNDISKDDGCGEGDDERLGNLNVVISKRNNKKREGDEVDPAARSAFAKKKFLKLLLRLRRAVLQDAVALIHKGWLGPALNDPVFQSVEVEKFRKQVVEALERRDITLRDNIPLSVVNELRAMLRQNNIMLGIMKELSKMASNAMRKLEQLYGREETLFPSQFGSFYVNRSHDQGQYSRVSEPATATSSSNPLQI